MKESHATTLLADIQLLIEAHDRLLAAKERIRKSDPSQHEQIDSSPALAAWLYFKGLETDEQVFTFVKTAWDNYVGNKSQLWVWHGSDKDEPITESVRFLDRIDMAMGLVGQRTQTTMPVKSVRDSGWHPDQHLRRILAFAQAASDLE